MVIISIIHYFILKVNIKNKKIISNQKNLPIAHKINFFFHIIIIIAIDFSRKICDNIKGKPFFISPLP